MSDDKRYFWLRLYDDFFTSKRIKKLRGLAGGDTYTIIYLKMQLKALKSEGYLYFDSIMNDFAEELALDIDEKPDDVRVTIQYLMSVGLMESNAEGEEFFLTYMPNLIGSETASTQRVRSHRARKRTDIPKIEAKTNAERQNSFRAKKVCEESGHVPLIEDHVNKKRYGGNYYICFKRDKCECAICGSKDDLCLHHIDEYDENKPQNSFSNKMITLCRKCHSNVHAGEPIPKELLESIGYYDDCNESNENCNANVTEVKRGCNVEIEIEKEKEIEKREKATKHKHGEYGHVLLTEEQYIRLCDEYGEEATLKAIKKVDEYCQQYGKSYKDYNLTLRKWGFDGIATKKSGGKTNDPRWAFMDD